MNQTNSNLLRDAFSVALSSMYQQEVPLYGDLLSLVDKVNLSHKTSPLPANIKKERHGAIRLGKASELNNIRRLFHLLGMYPVAYYDLSAAGLPVHSTAFRPLTTQDLDTNPFRVFTSLLRLDLINDKALSKQASKALQHRDIFSDELLKLIEIGEHHTEFDDTQFNRFITLSIDVFKWHDEALVSNGLYQKLKASHPLIADIVSFKGPHINHLTPSTIDIDAVQASMIKNNIKAKAVIEGPPLRRCPILLRQTSFTAIAENVHFKSDNGTIENGEHTARFGEIEQRGIALTKKGQHLYERLIQQVKTKRTSASYDDDLKQTFDAFPDSYEQLRLEKLAYFKYVVNDSNLSNINDFTGFQNKSIEQLVDCNLVSYSPILYEDFLPVSAAGIFHSNLNNNDNIEESSNHNQHEFEQDLGCLVIDPFALYEEQEKGSIEQCLTYFQNN